VCVFLYFSGFQFYSCWAGASDADSEGNWVWVSDNSTVSFYSFCLASCFPDWRLRKELIQEFRIHILYNDTQHVDSQYRVLLCCLLYFCYVKCAIMLNVTMLSVIGLNIGVLSVIILNVTVLSVIGLNTASAGCYYADYCYAEYQYAEY